MSTPTIPLDGGFPGSVVLASGSVAYLDIATGKVVDIVNWDDDGQEPDERGCSICDALGHGYPGGGPCPLEDVGYDTDGVWV